MERDGGRQDSPASSRIGFFGFLGHLAGRTVGLFRGAILHLVAGILADLDLGAVALGFLLGFAFALLLLLLGFVLVLVLLVLGIQGRLVGHVEGGEQLADVAGEAALVLDVLEQAVEVAARAVLDEVAPEIDDLGRGGGGFCPVRRSRTMRATASSSGASARSVISSYLPPRW